MAASNRVWKVVGLAGLVGVVATGALIARGERERRSYTPDEVRERLQRRFADSQVGAADDPPGDPDGSEGLES
jgi:hypothetical protein